MLATCSYTSLSTLSTEPNANPGVYWYSYQRWQKSLLAILKSLLHFYHIPRSYVIHQTLVDNPSTSCIFSVSLTLLSIFRSKYMYIQHCLELGFSLGCCADFLSVRLAPSNGWGHALSLWCRRNLHPGNCAEEAVRASMWHVRPTSLCRSIRNQVEISFALVIFRLVIRVFSKTKQTSIYQVFFIVIIIIFTNLFYLLAAPLFVLINNILFI